MITLGIIALFILAQLINGITNILLNRAYKRRMAALEKIRTEEASALFQSYEAINIHLVQIHEIILNMGDFQLPEQRDMIVSIEDEIIQLGKKIEGKPGVIRGKYKPRAKKAIEHKKSPPE